MKIYTKGGDKGKTTLIGGKRVFKYDKRIEAYGTVDEVIAYIGLIRDHLPGFKTIDTLIEIQDKLMTCAAILASDCDDCNVRIPYLDNTDIVFLEKQIDAMSEKLAGLKSFLLPGGHPVVSYCHVARTVCRRAERRVVDLLYNSMVPELVLIYLNRLSDYLFTLSRVLSVEFQADEIKWEPTYD